MIASPGPHADRQRVLSVLSIVVGALLFAGMVIGGNFASNLNMVLGVLFIALVQNAMIINGVGVFWQGIIIGAVLLLAVSLDRFKQTHRA